MLPVKHDAPPLLDGCAGPQPPVGGQVWLPPDEEEDEVLVDDVDVDDVEVEEPPLLLLELDCIWQPLVAVHKSDELRLHV